MKRLVLLLAALILVGSALASTGTTSQAKVTKGVLTGTVYDPNHAVIGSAEVLAQSPEGQEYWATTNTDGVYKFELPLASYRIEANAPGFCPKRVEVFKLRSSRPGPLDFVLEVKPPAVLVLDAEGRVVREREGGGRGCPQQTMIRKERPQKQDRKSIAERKLSEEQ